MTDPDIPKPPTLLQIAIPKPPVGMTLRYFDPQAGQPYVGSIDFEVGDASKLLIMLDEARAYLARKQESPQDQRKSS